MPKHDVRNHSVLPLRIQKGDDFQPGAPLVKLPDAERGKTGIPVPLIRIQPASGNGITAPIIHFDNVDCFFDPFGQQAILSHIPRSDPTQGTFQTTLF